MMETAKHWLSDLGRTVLFVLVIFYLNPLVLAIPVWFGTLAVWPTGPWGKTAVIGMHAFIWYLSYQFSSSEDSNELSVQRPYSRRQLIRRTYRKATDEYYRGKSHLTLLVYLWWTIGVASAIAGFYDFLSTAQILLVLSCFQLFHVALWAIAYHKEKRALLEELSQVRRLRLI